MVGAAIALYDSGAASLSDIVHQVRENRRRNGLHAVDKAGERLLAEAMRFAFEQHAGQYRHERHPRTGAKLPFYEHVSSVAWILAEAGYTQYETIAAGALHDLERTGKTRGIELAQERFDDTVMDIVLGVTCFDEYRGLKATQAQEKRRQKEEFMQHFLVNSVEYPECLAVKAADRIHNMRSIGECPPATQRRMVEETILMYIPMLEHFDPVLQQMLREQVAQFRDQHESLLKYSGAESVIILEQLIGGYSHGRMEHYTRAAKQADELCEALSSPGEQARNRAQELAEESGIELKEGIEGVEAALEYRRLVQEQFAACSAREQWLARAIEEHQQPITRMTEELALRTMGMLTRRFDAPNMPLIDRLDRPLVSPGEGRYIPARIRWHDDMTRLALAFTRTRQDRLLIDEYFTKASCQGARVNPDTPEREWILGLFKTSGLTEVWFGTYATTTHERVTMYQGLGDGRSHQGIIDALRYQLDFGEPALAIEMNYDAKSTCDQRWAGHTGVRLIYDMLFNAPRLRAQAASLDRDAQVSLTTWMTDHPWTIVDIVDP